jgi:hypothetical protein
VLRACRLAKGHSHPGGNVRPCSLDGVNPVLAGWFNEDDIGKYMTIQLSAQYQRPEYRHERPFWDFR